MSIELTRRKKLLDLMDEHGGQKALADKTDLPASYLSQIKNGHRNLGSNAARKIEMKLGLAKGWMDTLDGDHENLPIFYRIKDRSVIPKVSHIQAANWASTKKPYPASFTKMKEVDFEPGERCYIVTMPDNYLEPEIMEGTLIALDPDLEPEDDALCAWHFPKTKNGFVIGKYQSKAGQKQLRFSDFFAAPILITDDAKYCGRAVYQFGRTLF